MATRRTAKRGGVQSPFLDWLEKYWVMLLGILFFLPTVMKWIKDINVTGQKDDMENEIELNSSENSVQSPQMITDKVDQYLPVELKIAKDQREKLKADTIALVHNLGTRAGSSWYNVDTWTENDAEVEKILKRQVHNYKVIERLYFMAYTESRNLTNDILKYLDKTNLTRVRAFWAQYNKSYL